MRYMILVKATRESEAGAMPHGKIGAEMAAYHEELARGGVLLDASGLHPTAKGWRVRYSGGQRTIVDGPFTETKELIAGYTILEVRSEDEAREWTRRFPNPAGPGAECEIEVRRLLELEHLGSEEWVDRFRGLDLPAQREDAR